MKESISIDAIRFRGEISPFIHSDENRKHQTNFAKTDEPIIFVSNFDNSNEISGSNKTRTSDVSVASLDDREARLGTLPSDVLYQIFLFCGPRDVDEGIKLVNRRF